MSIVDSDYDDDEVDLNGARPKDTDRYGFTGGNQFTREGDISIPISVLRKREMKWLDMMDDWDKWMTKKPKKVRERCRKGIPSSLRCRAWQRLCGGQLLMEKNQLRFKELDDMPGDPKWVDTINKDLDRQFPFHEMFAEKGGSGQQDLFRILKAYSIYNPRDGYCQAMAPVAAVLLMHMPAEEAFWCFVQICDRYLTGYYSPGLEAVQVDGEVLHSLLKKVSPATYKHLKKQGVDPILYMTEWFMCIFARTLPWSSVLRVWDIFLFEGVKVLFRVALVILKCCLGTPESLKKYHGLYEALQILKNIPQEYLGEQFLVEEMLKIHVFEKEIESQHSLTVARRKAMRTRQLARGSASDMLKKIEDLKKQKKKVRPPKPTDDDDTKSIISYTGFGNQESPVKHKRKKEKKKKAKDRDPGVAIYRQNLGKSAWSEPEDQSSQTSEFSDYTMVGTTRSERLRDSPDHGPSSLGVNKQTSRSEGALNLAARYQLGREPSIESSIHEEDYALDHHLDRDPAERNLVDNGSAPPPWVDSSPSKSSSAIPDDSSSSSSQYVELRAEDDGTDVDLVMFVRGQTRHGGYPNYPLQLPGAVDGYDKNDEEFEGNFERNILDLSFTSHTSATSPNERTFPGDFPQPPEELLAMAPDDIDHSSSVESRLKPDGSVQVDYNSSDTLKEGGSETTLHISENTDEDGAASPTGRDGASIHPIGYARSGVDPLSGGPIGNNAAGESSQDSYIVETNPDFSEEYEMQEPGAVALSREELLRLSAEGRRADEMVDEFPPPPPPLEVESGGRVVLQFEVDDDEGYDNISGEHGNVGNVEIGIENSERDERHHLHYSEEGIEGNPQSGGVIFMQDSPVGDSETEAHIDDFGSGAVDHDGGEEWTASPYLREEKGGKDFQIDSVGSPVNPHVDMENSGEKIQGIDSDANEESHEAASSDDGTSVDPIINVNVILPGTTDAAGVQSDPIAVRISPLEDESRGDVNSMPTVDQAEVVSEGESSLPTSVQTDNIPGGIEPLPLSETDSSSVSDGRANGGSVNGASNSDSWLLDDLNELQEAFGVLGSGNTQGGEQEVLGGNRPKEGESQRGLMEGSGGKDAQEPKHHSQIADGVNSPQDRGNPPQDGKEVDVGGFPQEIRGTTVVNIPQGSRGVDMREVHRATNGDLRVAVSGIPSDNLPPTKKKPPIKPRKPDPPRRAEVQSLATDRLREDNIQGITTTTGPSPKVKPKSGKKPVPLPKKPVPLPKNRVHDKRVIRGPINKSMVTDKL